MLLSVEEKHSIFTGEKQYYLWISSKFTPAERLIYDELVRIYRSNSNNALLFMGNTDGQFTQAPAGLSKAPGYDPRQRPWYQEAMLDADELTFTSPYVSSDGINVCSILIKTYDHDGALLGLVGIDYSLDALLADLDNRRILNSGYVVTIAPSGKIMSAGHESFKIGALPEELSDTWRKALATPGTGVHGITSDGEHKYIIINSLDSLGWKLAVVFDYSELMASAYYILRIMLLSAAVILGLTIVVGFSLASSIVRPIVQLVSASKIISSGAHENSEEARATLQRQLNVKSAGETSELADALRTVINTLEQRIQAARRDSHAKSLFLANMSHEVRTPLNAITGLARLLLQTNLDPLQRDYATKTLSAANVLLGLVDDVLDFSALEEKDLMLEKAQFSLTSLITEVENIFRTQSEASEISLQIDVNSDVPNNFYGDKRRIRQILTKLLDNAFKFTNKGSISLNVTLLGQHEGQAKLQFNVRDTGIGIAQEALESVFLPFFQADLSYSRKYGGVGLSLPFARNLARQMGGDIVLDSKENEGTKVTFTCLLPLAASEDNAESDARSDQTSDTPDLSGLRALLVEDNEINAIIALELLNSAGITATHAANGEEALSCLAQASEQGHSPAFDLILMDLQMPVMDGYEAVRRIRANPVHTNLPIIAVTAHTLEEERDRCRELGMNGHLSKPIDVDEFYRVLRELGNQGRQTANAAFIDQRQ
ncbi:response regulator [Desulfovibrio sp. OttesenSCG-928-M16]|nr:response regulator [Desulfovibrio sp. OttesenSCG-928-M16]